MVSLLNEASLGFILEKKSHISQWMDARLHWTVLVLQNPNHFQY